MLLSTNSLDLINQPLQKSITRADAKSVHKELPPGGAWKTINGHHIYIKDGKVLAGAVPGVGKAKKATKAQLQEHQQTIDKEGAKSNDKKSSAKADTKNKAAQPAAAKPGGKKASTAAGKKGGEKVDAKKPVPKAKTPDGPSRKKAGEAGAAKPKSGKSTVKRNDGGPAMVVSKNKGESKPQEEAPAAKKKGAKVDGGNNVRKDKKRGDVGKPDKVTGRDKGAVAGKPDSSAPAAPDAKPKKTAKPKEGPAKPAVPVQPTKAEPAKPQRKRNSAAAAGDGEAKPAKGKGKSGRSAASVADVRTEGQLNNELAYDVGATVWGSRKDQAAAREALNDKVKRGVSVRGTLADLEKLDPGAAKKYCTKDNILQKYDWEAQQRQGVDLPVAVMKKMIFDRILPKPDKDDPEVRAQYAYAIEELHRLLTPVKTMDELKGLRSTLRERMNLELPGHLAQQERYLKYAEERLKEEPRRSEMYDSKWVVNEKGKLVSEDTPVPRKEIDRRRKENVEKIKANIAQYHENAKNPYHVLGEKLTNFFTDSDSANRTIDTVRKKDMKWEDYLSPQEREAKPKRNRKAEWERKVDDPWFRSGGRAGKVQKPEDAIKQFKLRGLQFGHWVDDASGKFHLLKASEALQDMADALGMKDSDVSLNGRLALAFGARGTGGKNAAVAHYESALQVINLTKEGGAGSLAHEWGHALDDIMSIHSGIPAFASENPDQLKQPEVRKAYTELMDAIYKGDGSHKGSEKVPNKKKMFSSIYPRRREAVQKNGLTPEVVEHFTKELDAKFDREQRVIEGTIEKLKSMGYDTTRREKELKNHLFKKKRALNELYQELMYHHYRHTGEQVEHLETPTDHSEYYSRMKEADGERSKPYFSTGREMFARAFESWMQDTLGKKGTQNHYLVSGTTEKDVKYFGAPFPIGSERKLIFEKMGNLMKAVVGTGEIKKALEFDLMKSFNESEHPRDDFGKFVAAVHEHNAKLTKLAQRFGSAEEFAQHVDRPGFGGKSIAEITEMIDNNSHNHLDLDGIKTTLAQGGQQYYLTHVDPKTLYVQDEGHLTGIRTDAFDQSKAKPIIVGDNKFVVDGRHRNVNAKMSGVGQILAYVPAKHFYNQHVLGELQKSVAWDESKHPRRDNGQFGTGEGVVLYHGTALVHAETILQKGFKAQRSGNGDMGKCAYFKSPEWDQKEADDWGHTERTVNHFAEESGEKKDSAPRVIKAMIPREHLLDCSKGRPQELQDMIDATRYKGLKNGEPRWNKNSSPYEAYAKKHGIKAIIDKLDTVWEDEGWQIGVYDPKIIQIIDSGKAVEGSGDAIQLLKALTSEAPYALITHEYTANGDLVIHVGAR